MADNYCKCCGDGTPEYIIELNQQGAPGKRGEKGDEGYSPVVDFIANDNEIRFTSTNENNITSTPNLYDFVLKKDGTNALNPVTINGATIMSAHSGMNTYIDLEGTSFIRSLDHSLNLKGGSSTIDLSNNGAWLTYNGTRALLATVKNISNSKITISQGDVVKGSFTLNQSGDTTINLDSGGEITNPLKIEVATEDNPSGGTVTYSMELGLDSSNRVYLNRNSKFVQPGSIAEVSENIVKDNQIYAPIYKTAMIVDNDVNRRLTIGYDTDSKLYIRNYLTNSGNTYKSMAPITSDIINYPIYLEEVTGTPGLEGAYTIKLNYDNNTLKLNESNQLYTDFTGVNNSISELTTLVDAKNDNIFDIGKFTVVGSPTITDDGVATFTASGQYLTFNRPVDMLTKPWCIKGFVNSLNQFAYNAIVKLDTSSYRNRISFANDLSFVNFSLYDGTSEKVSNRLILDFNNHSFSYEWGFDGIETYTLKFKRDIDTDWQIISMTLSNPIVTSGDVMCISAPVEGVNGSIDLKHFSITVDGEEIFNGLMSSTKPIYDKITTTNTTLSTFQTDTTNNFSAVNSALNEKANISDLANYVPLATYNALLARVEALEAEINGGNA